MAKGFWLFMKFYEIHFIVLKNRGRYSILVKDGQFVEKNKRIEKAFGQKA